MFEIFDEIRNFYDFKLPCEELKAHIEFFSESNEFQFPHDQISINLFPSFTPTIWFNLGKPYKINSHKGIETIAEDMDVLVLRNSNIERIILPGDHIFTVKFNPTFFEHIFDFSQSAIGHDIIQMNQIFNASLSKKLKLLSCFTDRVEFLEKIFVEKLKKTTKKTQKIDIFTNAIQTFEASNHTIKISKIASDLAIGHKTFYRYFKENIGTSPENYFGLIRARNALQAYANNKKSFSPYDFGYFDFGHFSKDVVRFTGKPLSFFLL